MRLEGPARRLTIFVGEDDHAHGSHRCLYNEIVVRARKAGLAGATVLRGIEGFGASSVVHTTRILSLTEDLPVVITIVDDAARIDAFAAELDEIVDEGLVIVEDVHVLRYVGRPKDDRRHPREQGTTAR